MWKTVQRLWYKKYQKGRYLGLVGRAALHIFDLHEERFLLADQKYGYMKNCMNVMWLD